MNKINFQNGTTKVNASTFNTFQSNIEQGIEQGGTLTINNISGVGNIGMVGKLVTLNIATSTQRNNVINNTAELLTTLEDKFRPKSNLIVMPVVSKDENYAIIPNCYIILRNTGALEFYQASGASKNVKQILGQLSYFVN